MATLFNTKIKDTYQSLLKLEDNTILTTTVKNVTDGLGNASPLYMSTTRIGIGTDAPVSTMHIAGLSTFVGASGSTLGSTTAGAAAQFYQTGFGGVLAIGGYANNGAELQTYWGGGSSATGSLVLQRQAGQLLIGSASLNSSVKVTIKGSGSTSATTSLLVQNSAGTELFTVKDGGSPAIILGANTGYSVNDFQFFDNGGSISRLRFQSAVSQFNGPSGGGQIILRNISSVAGTEFSGTNGTNNATASIFKFTNAYAGNMGVGTAQNFIEINPTGIGNQGGTPFIRAIYVNNTTTGFAKNIAFENTTGDVLLGTTSGFVGIGTSNPTNKLEVIGAGRISSTLNVGGDSSVGSSYSSGFIAYDTGNGYAHSLIHAQAASLYLFANPQGFAIAGYEPASSGLSASNLAFMTSSSTRMKILSNGNVLIGTTTDAGYKLDVNGSARVKANSLTLSASGLSSPPANYVGINFDDSGNHHQNWFAINSKADPGSGITTGYNRIIFPTMGASNPATWNFNALGAASAIQLSAVNSTTGNYLTLSDSSISFVGVWNVVSIDRTNRKLVFGNMVTDVNHLAVYDVVIKGAKPNEGNYGGAASNGGNVYVVGGTPATSPTGNYGNVILAHDGTAIRGNVGIGTNAPTATTHIKGAGSTSATSSLLVQNSSSTRSLEITDDGNAFIGGNTLQFSNSGNCKIINNFGTMQLDNNGTAGVSLSFTNGAWGSSSRACFGDQGTGAVASAQVEIKTTTRGFLPPRMTNAQKLAINLPAAGLQVYDTTLNQMSYFNGTTWVNF